MHNQKTPQDLIEKSFGNGWEYYMDLTASNCEVFIMRDKIGNIIHNKTLYSFYGERGKFAITENPWEVSRDISKEDHRGIV